MERSFKTVPDDLRCRGVETPSDGTFFVEYEFGHMPTITFQNCICPTPPSRWVVLLHICCIDIVSHTTLYHTFPDSLMVDLDDPAEPDMQGVHGMARTSHCNLKCSSYRGATGRT